MPTEPTQQAEPAVAPVAEEIRNDVKQQVDAEQTHGTIRTRVVTHLVDAEIERRTNLLVKAMANRKAAAKEVDKIKPDQVQHEESGKVAMTSYSKAKIDELKKCKKKLSKIDKAINRAINEADYDGLQKGGKPTDDDENDDE